MVRSQYMTLFTECGKATAKAVVESERGLGKSFEVAVRKLLDENKKSTAPELVVAFDTAIEAMEEAARTVLVEAFGEYDHNGKAITLTGKLPAFKAYKSAYRTLLRKLGAEAATLPSLGINAVKKKVAELKQPAAQGDDGANKGPGTGNAGDAGGDPTNDTGTTGGDSKKKHRALDPEVQKHLDNYAAALANLPKERALGMVKKSEEIAWGALKNLGNKVAQYTKKDAA